MNATPRTSLAGAAGLLTAALLAGCATGMDKNQCVAADWRTIGYEDGLHGFPADRIGAHRVACSRFQVAPDLAAYTEGRQRGLVEYCQPKNGFRVGLHGGGYANVCSGPTEQSFVNGYQWGRQIYDARSELNNNRARLRNARDGLSRTDTAIAAATAELLLPNLPKERRIFLATELVQLGQERTEFSSRIDLLSARTQQLASNVQQLERQSPYPL
jgi:Protein of unknown function (DUF2799)